MAFRVATYNILDPVLAVSFNIPAGLDGNGEDNWDSRFAQIIENIKIIRADILCLQEVNNSLFKDEIKPSLMSLGYTVEYIKHSDKNKVDGVAICYKARFKSLGHAWVDYTFKRVDKKESESTLSHQILTLEDQATQKVIHIANCHLAGGGNGVGAYKEKTHIKSVLDSLEDIGIPANSVILAGDFNADKNHPRNNGLKPLFKYDGNDANTEQGSKPRKIDWIWAKKHTKKEDALLLQPVTFSSLEKSASDHLPVATDCVFADSMINAAKLVSKHASKHVSVKAEEVEKLIDGMLPKLNDSGNSIDQLRIAASNDVKAAIDFTFTPNAKKEKALVSDPKKPSAIAVKQSDAKLAATSTVPAASVATAKEQTNSTFPKGSFKNLIMNNFKLPPSCTGIMDEVYGIIVSSMIQGDSVAKATKNTTFQISVKAELVTAFNNCKYPSKLQLAIFTAFDEAFNAAAAEQEKLKKAAAKAARSSPPQPTKTISTKKSEAVTKSSQAQATDNSFDIKQPVATAGQQSKPTAETPVQKSAWKKFIEFFSIDVPNFFKRVALFFVRLFSKKTQAG